LVRKGGVAGFLSGQETLMMAQEASGPALQSVGNYDLLDKVAEGGMGTVYRGRNRETGQIVAVKVVAAHMAGNPVLLKRFEQEYKAAQQLNHPNIVRALDYGESGSTPYLVMEFVEGESLGRRIEREGRLPWREAIRLIAQVAQGLHHAHKEKLVHRDVKPDNILITPDGQAKLADLGLVKEMEADLNLTRTGRGLGTPHFMAPEQFKNAKDAGPRCDIYSLGATLYMMVTGEMPFRSSGPLDAYMKKMENKLVPPRQLVPSLTERVDWAICRAMSSDPKQRPASCREFVEDLTGRSTRKIPTVEGNSPQDLWYLNYKDENGVGHTVRGAAPTIRKSLKDGLLGDASNIRASRTKDSTFEPLRNFPEFRDLVILPASLSPAAALTPTIQASSLTPTATPRIKDGQTVPTGDEPTQPVRPAVGSRSKAPRIDLPTSKPEINTWPAWVQVVLLLLVVVVSAVAGYFWIFR
jgi:serine/threonine protein kinase